MTALAAVIEAFWSSRTHLPFELKIAFGATLTLVFALYLGFGGRGRAA